MIEEKEIFERKQNPDTFDHFDTSSTSLKSLTNVNNSSILDLSENEQIVNEDRLLIKSNGVMKELVLEDNKIFFKEI